MKSVGVIACVIFLLAADHFGGPIAYMRAFGLLWVLAVVWSLFVKELPIRLGKEELGRVRGTAKAFFVIPALALGLLLIAYAPEVTCWSQKYKHLCAAG
ncbi:hypothetical protein [Roseateles sp. BYS96W]|uniref:Uncharacterized protein n=1 Tax=Pelomonas nitida TaxID=3299027 RepID=A0ABW7GB86_9BURK